MAQTSDGMSMANAKIEISEDGNTWTDISGFANSISPDGGELQTGEAYTFDGENAIITTGKKEPLDITFSIVYTEGATDAADVIRGYYDNKTNCYIRWSPAGGNSGDKQFTAQGYIVNPVLPGGEAGSADPVLIEITLRTPKVTVSTVA